MINYFDIRKSVPQNGEAFNQAQGMSLKIIANKNEKNCINYSKLYRYEGLSSISYMSKLKEISEKQLIGHK